MYVVDFTDDPVRDAERYDSMAADRVKSREYKTCAFCGFPIHKEDDLHHGDVYYEIDGVTVCDNCVMDYILRFRKEFE